MLEDPNGTSGIAVEKALNIPITTPILLAMSCMTSVYSLAIDGPSTINRQPMPDRWIRYDLTPVKIATTDVSLTDAVDLAF
ncbi:hypothetical protein BCON_0195g00290 [Botryotinia convoluta]|uniref:Uncharacterized protein n=1 Tax=Botryotinia convoluta TaxID=54673 RepID=A0A4Z1HMU8_9HELO|nr:hypothetical protein BCON_0195g00290 [Botryotinia convoluta]